MKRFNYFIKYYKFIFLVVLYKIALIEDEIMAKKRSLFKVMILFIGIFTLPIIDII